MIKVEVSFVMTTHQTDGSDRFFHEAKGWAKDAKDSSLKTLVREVTNIQSAIEIVAWRKI